MAVSGEVFFGGNASSLIGVGVLCVGNTEEGSFPAGSFWGNAMEDDSP